VIGTLNQSAAGAHAEWTACASTNVVLVCSGRSRPHGRGPLSQVLGGSLVLGALRQALRVRAGLGITINLMKRTAQMLA
jgi:hypothetical protein